MKFGALKEYAERGFSARNVSLLSQSSNISHDVELWKEG